MPVLQGFVLCNDNADPDTYSCAYMRLKPRSDGLSAAYVVYVSMWWGISRKLPDNMVYNFGA